MIQNIEDFKEPVKTYETPERWVGVVTLLRTVTKN